MRDDKVIKGLEREVEKMIKLKNGAKRIVSVFAVCGLIMWSSQDVQAYTRWEQPFNSKNIVFRWGDSIKYKSYLKLIKNSALSWNTYTCVNLKLATAGGYNILVSFEPGHPGYYGVTKYNNRESKSITLTSTFEETKDVYKREVVVHEFGHTLGLGHTQEAYKSKSVMRATGFNSKAYPLSDDIAGIRYLYGSK